MYVVGMHILETYSGKSYPEFARERIFIPLGMNSTTFKISEALETGRMTDGWSSSGRLLPHCFSDEVGSGMNAGPGGIISSTSDMA
jgi:CubicO group peptidase (beta-lactamase class C family)